MSFVQIVCNMHRAMQGGGKDMIEFRCPCLDAPADGSAGPSQVFIEPGQASVGVAKLDYVSSRTCTGQEP